MRLRLAFKLHGNDAELARQIADAAGVDVDKIAKLAMQRYMDDVIQRATAAQQAKEESDVRPQPSTADSVLSSGLVSSSSDSVSSQAPGQS